MTVDNNNRAHLAVLVCCPAGRGGQNDASVVVGDGCSDDERVEQRTEIVHTMATVVVFGRV